MWQVEYELGLIEIHSEFDDEPSFSLSIDGDAIDVSTDSGRGEYSTGTFQATVGGIAFSSSDLGVVITNDILSSNGERSWLFTIDVITDSALTGWFQVYLGGGPKEEGLGVLPLDFSAYSLPYFLTSFAAGSPERTNFYGTLSDMKTIPEPNSTVLIGLGLAGLAFQRRKHKLFERNSVSSGCIAH